MDAQSLPQLFGVIPTGCPAIINATSAASPTSLIYALPPRQFSHIVVFLLPGVALPPDTAASVYMSTTPQDPASFKFLGAIGPGKESAVFKVRASDASITLGISVEAAASVAAQMASLQQTSPGSGSSTDLVVASRAGAGAGAGADPLVLAQRIIKNAFNFLASFSGNVPVPGGSGTAGVEVVPLKAFEDWWRKFEGRIRSDPGFLDRDID